MWRKNRLGTGALDPTGGRRSLEDASFSHRVQCRTRWRVPAPGRVKTQKLSYKWKWLSVMRASPTAPLVILRWPKLASSLASGDWRAVDNDSIQRRPHRGGHTTTTTTTSTTEDRWFHGEAADWIKGLRLRPVTDEEKILKEEINSLRDKIAKETERQVDCDYAPSSTEQISSLLVQIGQREKELTQLICELDDKVRFRKRVSMEIRPGPDFGRIPSFADGPPSQSGTSSDSKNTEFTKRPSSQKMNDKLSRSLADRCGFQRRDSGFLASRSFDRKPPITNHAPNSFFPVVGLSDPSPTPEHDCPLIIESITEFALLSSASSVSSPLSSPIHSLRVTSWTGKLKLTRWE
ncbi:hypothetical protein KSP40_PGU006878 [Platanthera guangdongensis]|uniref:Uncharacterized protein n=1 Tax=Platanthera guangdongensis TaxID=2320717 RepID=A0ABR2LDM5_9ASPA